MSKSIGLTQLHYALKDADSNVLNLHDIAYLNLTNRQVARTSPILQEALSVCRNERDIALVMLNHCIDNPLLAAKWFLNLDLMPFQGAILQSLWYHRFPYLLASRGGSKTFILAVYALLRCILTPGTKVVIVSASFRQAKQMFAVMIDIYNSSPILRTLDTDRPTISTDACKYRIGLSSILALPMGAQNRIRGARANVVIADEFQVMEEESFQIVVMGFAAVSMSPDVRARRFARNDSRWVGYTDQEKNESMEMGNQIVLAGTAEFEFNHAYRWYTRYLNILKTRGNKDSIRALIGQDISDAELKDFNYKDFAVITLPYTKLPPGFLDEKLILAARMQMPEEIFAMEYMCKWVKDTKGFIPMSLIRSRRTGSVANGSKRPCVMGIDPARSSDNFSIVISELSEDGDVARVIYTWSFNETRLSNELDITTLPKFGFWVLAALKVLFLNEQFNIKAIVMDKGGGGTAVQDVLKSPAMYSLPPDLCRFSLWDIEEEEVPHNGRQILSVRAFDNETNRSYNYMMKRDIESSKFLFSGSNEASAALSVESDKYDFLIEDFDMINKENDAMQREVSTVKIIKTIHGNVRFDTGKGGTKPKKDRYSACLYSYMAFKMIDEISNKKDPNEIEEIYYDTEGALCE